MGQTPRDKGGAGTYVQMSQSCRMESKNHYLSMNAFVDHAFVDHAFMILTLLPTDLTQAPFEQIASDVSDLFNR